MVRVDAGGLALKQVELRQVELRQVALRLRWLAAALTAVCLGQWSQQGSAQHPKNAPADAQAASAQVQPSQDGGAFTLSTQARLVVLDVVVLDAHGQPVTGLDRSQFTIKENGVPERLLSFEATAAHGIPAATALVKSSADLRRIGQAPVALLVLDELNTKFEDMAYGRQEMERYLQSQPAVLPQPTLLVAAGDRKFVVLHDYTQSRDDLEAALRAHRPQYPAQMMRSPTGYGALERMAQTLGVLDSLADSTRGTPGRKNILWIGEGYAAVDPTQIDAAGQAELQRVIRTTTDRLLAARVTLYMVDPSGVVSKGDDAALLTGDPDTIATQGPVLQGIGPADGKLDFAGFAAATGGKVFSGRNDVDREIREGMAQGAEYYTLSYAPQGFSGAASTSDDAAPYRKIRVTLKNPSLHAVTRDGYYAGAVKVDAPPAADARHTAGQLKFDLASAATSRLAYDGLNVEAQPTPGGFVIRVVAEGLEWKSAADGTRFAEVTAAVVCFDAKGRGLAQQVNELTLRIGAQESTRDGIRSSIPVVIDVPPKTARVRFVVRDAATGKIGTTEYMEGTAR
jgi:VWFA-related protein